MTVESNGNATAAIRILSLKLKDALIDFLLNAISSGESRLDYYGSILCNMCSKVGMVPVARVDYAREINPEMDRTADRHIPEKAIKCDLDNYFMIRHRDHYQQI